MNDHQWYPHSFIFSSLTQMDTNHFVAQKCFCLKIEAALAWAGNRIIVGPADGPLFSPGVHQDQTSKIQEQIPTFKLSAVDARLLLWLPNCSCQVSFRKLIYKFGFSNKLSQSGNGKEKAHVTCT